MRYQTSFSVYGSSIQSAFASSRHLNSFAFIDS
jgi:hypothetical protein